MIIHGDPHPQPSLQECSSPHGSTKTDRRPKVPKVKPSSIRGKRASLTGGEKVPIHNNRILPWRWSTLSPPGTMPEDTLTTVKWEREKAKAREKASHGRGRKVERKSGCFI